MTAAEILDACEHRQTRHPTYECCGRCNGACPDCAEKAIRAAVEAERAACAEVVEAYSNGEKEYCSDRCLTEAAKDIRARGGR